MIDVLFVGFLEKEIRKDGIPMLDTGDNPDAPAPREMIDLEVGTYFYLQYHNKYFNHNQVSVFGENDI